MGRLEAEASSVDKPNIIVKSYDEMRILRVCFVVHT